MDIATIRSTITRNNESMGGDELPMDDGKENGRPPDSGPQANQSPFFQGRLTKQVLFVLPEGAFLQSNVTEDSDPLAPIYEGVIGPPEMREELWRTLRDLRITGTMFRVFTTEESYDQLFLERVKALNPEDCMD